MKNTTQSADWKGQKAWDKAQIPAVIKDVIFDPASTTEHVQRIYGESWEVQVLKQEWGFAQPDEYQALGIGDNEKVMLREVILSYQGQPWMYGRTIVPNSTWNDKNNKLSSMGDTSLGKILFSDPSHRRSEFEIAFLGVEEALFQSAIQGLDKIPQSLWARRSIFYLSEKPLLLTEVFLPDYGQVNNQHVPKNN